MGIAGDIKKYGAAFRATDETLRAEAMRELETGEKLEGLWSLALIETAMDEISAGDAYIRLRVRSLRDLMVLSASAAREEARIRHLKDALAANPEHLPVHPGCGGILDRCIKDNYVSWTCMKCNKSGSLVRGAPPTGFLRKKREDELEGRKYWESSLFGSSKEEL